MKRVRRQGETRENSRRMERTDKVFEQNREGERE